MIFIPNSGNDDSTKGSTAQWIAQASEVAIPSASQFILNRMARNYRNFIKCNGVANDLLLMYDSALPCCTFAFMSKKAIILTSFFILLVFGFYAALTRFIPGYGDQKFQVLNYVKPFSFTDQDGRRVNQDDLRGKVYVAEYFFTTCKSICPILNRNMKQVYDAFKEEPGFMILSHTVDPETDSVRRLKFYADSLKVDAKHWLFLTGPKDSLYEAARSSYLLDDPKNNNDNIEDQFLHTQFFALVDKNGQVRKKIYDGLKKNELAELKKDIAVLLKEAPTQARFSNNIFSN